MNICPNCGSSRVGKFRLDSDWAAGAGDWTCGNPDSRWFPDIGACYTEEDIRSFEQNDRPDIDCYICCVCNTCFG